MKRRFLFFGLLGICLEVIFTGVCSMVNRDAKLKGTTSLWMIPIYGTAAFLGPLCGKLRRLPAFVRGFIYTSLIYFVEFMSGWVLKRLGSCPWDYSKSRFNIKGLIRLDFAPLWFVLGLFFERLQGRSVRKRGRIF